MTGFAVNFFESLQVNVSYVYSEPKASEPSNLPFELTAQMSSQHLQFADVLGP